MMVKVIIVESKRKEGFLDYCPLVYVLTTPIVSLIITPIVL